MKKVLVLLTLVAAVSAYSQGKVNFNNAATTAPQVIVPFFYEDNSAGPVKGTALKIDSARNIADGGFAWGGVNAMAGLYGGAPGAAFGTMVLLVPSVGFRSGAAAGYINVGSSGERTLSTIAPGSPADFQVRVWDCGVAGIDTYESAVTIAGARGAYLGVSGRISIAALGGAGSPPSPAANLGGLTTVTLQYVPEPSIIGLGILGTIAGLLVFRRRQ